MNTIKKLILSLLVLSFSQQLSATNQEGLTDYFARTAILLTPTFFPSPVEWSLHSDGRVYFEAFKQSSSENGLYITGGPGGFQTIFESGDPAPDLIGFNMFGPSLWIGHDNGYAFQVRLEGPGVTPSNDIALYSGTLASGPQLVFREGDPVDGIPGATYSFGANEIKVNQRGDVLFQVGFNSGPPFSALMFKPQGGAISVITSEPLVLQKSVISESGNVAFFGVLNGIINLWSGPPSNPQILISEGDSVPGTFAFISQFEKVTFSSDSVLSFAVELTNGNDAVFKGLPNGTQLVKESINIIALLTTDFYGRLAFNEYVPTGNELSLKRYDEPATLVAKAGDQAPNMPNGVVFFQFYGLVNNLFRQVAFSAQLDGTGVGTNNDVSLWIYDPSFGTEAIARENSSIQINPADTRTIQSIIPDIQSISLRDGGKKSFNNRGELVYLANFTDGDAALLVGQRQSPDPVFDNGFE